MQRVQHEQHDEPDRAVHVEDPRYRPASASGRTLGRHNKEDRPDARCRQSGPQSRAEQGRNR